MIKVRTFTKTYALGKKRKLTLAAKISPFYNWDIEDTEEGIACLEIAMAIRNPEDDYLAEIGKTIALNRLNHANDFNVFEAYYNTLKHPIFLRADTVYGQMDQTAAWIKDNQELFF